MENREKDKNKTFLKNAWVRSEYESKQNGSNGSARYL